MRKNFKWIVVIAFVSFFIILAYWLSYDCSEWFPEAGRIFTIAESLSVGFVSAFIFFCIVQYGPYLRRYDIANKNKNLMLQKLNINLRELLRLSFMLSGVYIQPHSTMPFDNLKTEKSNDISKFALQDVTTVSIIFSNEPKIYVSTDNNIDCYYLVNLLTTTIQKQLAFWDSKYEYIDEELVELLMEIRDLDLFYIINASNNTTHLFKLLNGMDRKSPIKELILASNKLNDYYKKH